MLNRKPSPFLRAYIECALWSSTDEDSNPFEDFEVSDACYLAMAADCADFVNANREDLDEATDELHRDDEAHGHDFWLTRNRHGAGFWDRGYSPELSKRLTDAAHAYGEVYLYVNPDTDEVECD